MRRIAVIVAALALSGLACGGDEEEPPRAGSSESPACPQGTPAVKARDVIGTPPEDYRIVAGDFISRVADQNDISIEELEAANVDNPAYQVFAPGQELWLPCEGEDLGTVPDSTG